MGNLCGKQEASQEASPPGRRLGSTPAATRKATSSVPPKVGGPPRTLGSGPGSGSGPGPSQPSSAEASSSSAHDDARKRAAEAAEVGPPLVSSPLRVPPRQGGTNMVSTLAHKLGSRLAPRLPVKAASCNPSSPPRRDNRAPTP